MHIHRKSIDFFNWKAKRKRNETKWNEIEIESANEIEIGIETETEANDDDRRKLADEFWEEEHLRKSCSVITLRMTKSDNRQPGRHAKQTISCSLSVRHFPAYGNQPQKFFCCPSCRVVRTAELAFQSNQFDVSDLFYASTATQSCSVPPVFPTRHHRYLYRYSRRHHWVYRRMRMYHFVYLRLWRAKRIAEIDWLNIYSYGSA